MTNEKFQLFHEIKLENFVLSTTNITIDPPQVLSPGWYQVLVNDCLQNKSIEFKKIAPPENIKQDDRSLPYQVKAIPPKNNDYFIFCEMISARFGIGKNILKEPIVTASAYSFGDYWFFSVSASLTQSESLFFEYELRKFLIELGWKIVLA
ncbi:MAG: hypothetical protein ACRC2V_19285 [Xenococcaceae cyanobacterium]